LARSGTDFPRDRTLATALIHIRAMRGLVPHAVADSAIEATSAIFEQPTSDRPAQLPSAGMSKPLGLHELHPETAARINLARLTNFELERCEGAEGVYCFYARSKEVAGDERVFVLADMRGPFPDGGKAGSYVRAFDRTFTAATRALRTILSERDPQRRLQWNRITVIVGPEIRLERRLVERAARRMAPASRNLGL